MSSQLRRAAHAPRTPVLIFTGVAVALTGLALGAVHVLAVRHPHATGRLGYLLVHVPWAMESALGFTLAVAAALVWREQLFQRMRRSTAFCFLILAAAFCVFWLPVLISAGFVQDDWILLAAAAARQSLTLHPHLAWFALDTVDANFRPITTVLYVGWVLRAAGLHPVWLGLGNFIATLLTCAVAFRLVREFGYSRTAATAAPLLFLSRPLIYTQVAWMSALGDAFSIFFCAVTVLLTVIALRTRSAWRALALHLLAWSVFWLAVLSKQSAFVLPGVLAGLMLLQRVAWQRRIVNAMTVCVAYGGVVVLVFKHAQRMELGQTPYGIGITVRTVLRVFYHVGAFVLPAPLESRLMPGLTRGVQYLLVLAGMAAVALSAAKLWRHRAWLGIAPRHVLFTIFAGFVSLSLYVFLPTRGEAYYAGMGAFWFSLALAMVMSNSTSSLVSPQTANPARWPLWTLTALLVTGFTDVRLIQAGAAASGSYIWGDYSVARDGRLAGLLQEALRRNPALQSVVLFNGDTQSGFDAAIALDEMPRLSHIFLYDSATGTLYGNDRGGRRPGDGWPSYTDRNQYVWNKPLPGTAGQALSGPDTLWIDLSDYSEPRVIAAPPRPRLPDAVS